MEAYLVLSESQAFQADAVGKISADTLGAPAKVGYVALKAAQECAFQTALQHNAQKGHIATQETDWFVLHVTFKVDEALAMFQAGSMVRDIPRGGWRYFGELDFKILQHEWWQVKLAPIGMEAWADMVLGPRYKFKFTGHCNGCKATGVTWIGGKCRSMHGYCTPCWHAYFSSKFTEQAFGEEKDETGDVVAQ
jgi:hypothetical protein